MSSIGLEAKQMSVLFDMGIIPPGEVIEWADKKIVEMDRVPEELIQLSTSATEKTAEIISQLHRLAGEEDIWKALRKVLPRIRQFVASKPDAAERIANQFYLYACWSKPTENMNGLVYGFDDAFDLARTGTYGTWEDVYRDFLTEMDRITNGT